MLGATKADVAAPDDGAAAEPDAAPEDGAAADDAAGPAADDAAEPAADDDDDDELAVLLELEPQALTTSALAATTANSIARVVRV